MTGDEILTVAEVAVELRCSKAHVYNAIAGKVDGVFPWDEESWSAVARSNSGKG